MTTALTDAFLDHALAVAREAADAAAAVIARFYRGEFAVQTKADASPVTQADVESEQAIRRVLLQHFPDHAIYGEEEGRSGDGDFLWLVDPIDGTKAFVRRYPMFSTQIALMHRGELVLGVSMAGEYGETMWARRGGGAHFRGERVRIADTSALAQAAISTGNTKSLTKGRGWNVLAALIQGSHRIRGYGDFLHYHLLARGCIDVVIESDVNILDVAALAVIVREAGGTFTDLDGGALTLDTTTVLAATPALHADLAPRFEGWRNA